MPYFGAFTQLDLKKEAPQNQVERRMELSEKYSGVRVDWQQEIKDYAAWLKNKENNETDGTTGATSSTEANAGTTKDKKKTKTIKVKGFPFSQEEAVKKQAEASKSPRQLTVAPGITLDMVWIPAGTFAMGDNHLPSKHRLRKVSG